MFTSLALVGMLHPMGYGPGFLFFLIPLVGFLAVVLIFGLLGRRWRRHAWASGMGPWGHGHGYGSWAGAQAARNAETTLAERFAQGDIDEKEYRARLVVLRSNVPQPPMGPQK